MAFSSYFDMCLSIKDIEGRKLLTTKNENMMAFTDVLLQILHYLCYCISVFESPSSDIFFFINVIHVFILLKKGYEIKQFLECNYIVWLNIFFSFPFFWY